jgi:hypothetical protein
MLTINNNNNNNNGGDDDNDGNNNYNLNSWKWCSFLTFDVCYVSSGIERSLKNITI